MAHEKINIFLARFIKVTQKRLYTSRIPIFSYYMQTKKITYQYCYIKNNKFILNKFTQKTTKTNN